jgi:hypothetical protein
LGRAVGDFGNTPAESVKRVTDGVAAADHLHQAAAVGGTPPAASWDWSW